MEFKLETIQELVGDAFIANVRGPNRNVKLDFARLVNKDARNFSDDEKLDLLYQARNTLRDAGYDCTVRLSQRDRQGNWGAWPHLWVNRTAVVSDSAGSPQAEENSARIDRMENMLLAIASKIGVADEPETDGDAIVEGGDTSDEAVY